MSGTEWLVIIGGVGAIGWVNWYFLFAGRSPGRAGRGRKEGE